MFSSAHKRLDQLNRNIRWGLRGNFLDIPTDCPQRNERLGWTGDAQVFAPVALFHYDTHAFWASWLESMRLEQRADGTVPHVVPAGTRFADTESSPGWGDAMILIPWEVYLRTGDRRLLEENYAAMTRRLSDYNARSQDGLQTADEGFGDWLQPVMYAGDTQLAGDDRCFGETPRPFLATCYHGCCAHLMTRVAQVLGRQEDAIAHAQTHAQVRQAVTRTCFDDHGRLTLPVETQTGYVLPLAFDLVESSRREAVAGHLAERIKSDGSHLNTGFLGTASLLRALDENGHSTLACHLLFTREYPGWFYSIDQGATTIWERWNSYSHEAGFGDVKMNSFNHYAYGAVGQFLYERLAGLAPDPAAPGYRHLRIRPLFTGHPLTQASAELQTRYGLARNAWEKHDGKITMTTRVPPNATATIILPVTDPGDVKIHEGQAEFHRLDQGISAQVGAGTFKLSFRLPEGPSAS
jgi:alpha-L-rhamnosidase